MQRFNAAAILIQDKNYTVKNDEMPVAALKAFILHLN